MTSVLNKVRGAVITFKEPSRNGLSSGSSITARQARTGSAWPARLALGLALIVCILPSGCASFAEVTDLKKIQDTAGFYPKALYYCGSNEACHFFEQETPLGDLTPLSKHVRTIMVSRKEVRLPEGAEFLRSSYTGRPDTQRQKMRIHITQRNPNRGAAEYARSE